MHRQPLRLGLWLAVACLAYHHAGAVELTDENWEEHVKGKTVFLKYFAPWCGHCKKLKPDWDRLTKDFENSKKGLVAEIDCAGKGKPLCEKHGVSGYPKLMYGRADNLQDYNGERSYEGMKNFADERLGASCGPGDLDLCDADRRATLEKFKRRSPEKLDEMIALADKQINQAEYRFKVAEHNISDRIIRAEQKKNKKVSDIRKKGGMPRGKGAIELTTGNWDEHTAGKSVFIKFYAPWCGHCKSLKPAWDRLAADYVGTKNGLVAEVDCTGKGQSLCEKHEVTGYPRLLYGDPEEEDTLSKYSGPRDFDNLKEFALDQLGPTCGSGDIDLCDEDQKKWVKDLADLTKEEREERQKSTDGKVAKKERKFEELQWNLTGEIDIAEAKKNDQVKAIKAQGLAEAKVVQEWNKKQPEGFWKPPPAPPPAPEPKGFLGPLEEVMFEVAGYPVTGFSFLLFFFALLSPLLCMEALKPSKTEPEGRSCEARHILMKDKDEITKVKERIDAGESFEELAAECSFCNSKGEGGSLGLRVEGSMEPAINEVCFNPETELGAVVGPIETKFGFHLVRVDKRTGFEEDAAEEAGEGEEQDEAEGEKDKSEPKAEDDDAGAKKRKGKQNAENGKDTKGKEENKSKEENKKTQDHEDKKKKKDKKKDK